MLPFKKYRHTCTIYSIPNLTTQLLPAGILLSARFFKFVLAIVCTNCLLDTVVKSLRSYTLVCLLRQIADRHSLCLKKNVFSVYIDTMLVPRVVYAKPGSYETKEKNTNFKNSGVISAIKRATRS